MAGSGSRIRLKTTAPILPGVQVTRWSPHSRRFGWAERGAPRSGSHRLSPDHVDDPDDHHRSDQSDDEGHDESRRGRPKDRGEDEPTDEGTHDPQYDVPDDPVAVAAHDLAGEPSHDRAEYEKTDQMHRIPPNFPAAARPRGESPQAGLIQ